MRLLGAPPKDATQLFRIAAQLVVSASDRLEEGDERIGA
jgi:hypothetical protein